MIFLMNKKHFLPFSHFANLVTAVSCPFKQRCLYGGKFDPFHYFRLLFKSLWYIYCYIFTGSEIPVYWRKTSMTPNLGCGSSLCCNYTLWLWLNASHYFQEKRLRGSPELAYLQKCTTAVTYNDRNQISTTNMHKFIQMQFVFYSLLQERKVNFTISYGAPRIEQVWSSLSVC